MYKIAIDTGGTFTDFVAFKGAGEPFVLKVLSTPQDPLEAIKEGLNKIAQNFNIPLPILLSQTSKFVHGTTLPINALLQKKGAKVGLICTEGFRDALEIRRSRLKDQWDLFYEPTPVLVPRHLRLGIEERINYRGEIIKPLNLCQIEDIAKTFRKEKVEAIAICLLFSYQNPIHEKILKEQLLKLLPNVFITISSELSPQIGEYERTSTTVLDGYLSPLVQSYLAHLKSFLQQNGLNCPLYLMQNTGGLTDANLAESFGVKGLFSGPAGGTKGGQRISIETESPNTIIIDLGGTSFDVSLVSEYKSHITTASEINGYELNLPQLDIRSFGSGGGSIAKVATDGTLRVGPESAGAYPGPACYGFGGDDPTVTDAALILGLLNRERFFNGKIRLDLTKAMSVIKTKIAEPLDISVEEAAKAIYEVASNNMIEALWLMTVQEGFDPREFTLVVIGGAGPLFATKIASGLGIKKMIIPKSSPVFCAQGMLYATVQVDLNQSYLACLSELNIEDLTHTLSALDNKCHEELDLLGVQQNNRNFSYIFEMKYEDQHHQIAVELKDRKVNFDTLKKLKEEFDYLHKTIYGYNEPDKACWIVNIRLSAAEEREPKDEFFVSVAKLNPKTAGSTITRKTYLGNNLTDVPVYDVEVLASGIEFRGPLLVESAYSTTFTDEGYKLQLDTYGNIVIYKEINNYED